MKSIAILGAGGHGKVVAEIAELNGWQEIVFFDDNHPKGEHLLGWPVEGPTDTFFDIASSFETAIVAIGDNYIRATKTKLLKKSSVTLTNLIHPSAIISKSAELGSGIVAMANVVVNVSTEIGNGVILNTGCRVDHECKIGDFVHISPGVSLGGNVTIGFNSWIGIGASVKHSTKLGNDVIVGAGATVLDNTPDNVTVVGTPAKII